MLIVGNRCEGRNTSEASCSRFVAVLEAVIVKGRSGRPVSLKSGPLAADADVQPVSRRHVLSGSAE